MAKLKHVTAADHDRIFFVRWMLFLIVANEAAGLPPASRQRIHSLLFVSFASARFYGITPLRQRARKSEQGPYYRMAHVAIGHLVMGGLLDVQDFKAHPAPRDLQFEGTFRPTLSGLRAAELLRQTATGDRIYRFLLDMCLASADAIGPERSVGQVQNLDGALEADLTYQRAVRKYGDFLELQDPAEAETPTVEGLISINKSLSQRGFFNKRDIVAAYQSLMVRRVEGARS